MSVKSLRNTSLVLALTFAPAANAGVHIDDPNFRQCVDDAVTSVFPNAKGRYVKAQERAPLYQELGPMLHYRDRGLKEVHSVTVGTDYNLVEITSNHTIKVPNDTLEVYAATRVGDGFVFPSSIFSKNDPLRSGERKYMTNFNDPLHTSTFGNAQIAGKDEKAKVSQTQQTVVLKVLDCRFQ
jgi:hypothetical protein